MPLRIRQVTITGLMTWEEDLQPGPFPPSPNVPSNPIMLPGMPGWGQIPGFSGPGGGLPIWPGHPDYPTRPQPQPPLGFWGPNDPRPWNPIAGIPGIPGYNPPNPVQPPLGIWGPTDPRPWNPIAGIPGIPGYNPPLPGGGGPIFNPPPGTGPGTNPPIPGNPLPPSPAGPGGNFGWAWSAYYGWVLVPTEPVTTPPPVTEPPVTEPPPA